jgi:UDP-glucuronate 4-epimerase
MKVLLTGAAGFIGMHVCERLLARGDEVVGVDNLNDYYDVALKEARLARLTSQPTFHAVATRHCRSQPASRNCSSASRPQRVINLAAQAGVRYSLVNPHAYVDSNVVGFVNILEGCRHAGVEHFVYASSSSIYGGNERMPFSEHDNVDHPVSLYAATKKSNELMGPHLQPLVQSADDGTCGFLPCTDPGGAQTWRCSCLPRQFLKNRPIDVFNHGKMRRDFTYIDDIAEGVIRVLDRPPAANSGFRQAGAGSRPAVGRLIACSTSATTSRWN